jgi:hypothetical protein
MTESLQGFLEEPLGRGCVTLGASSRTKAMRFVYAADQENQC